ncbi:hypothetical protein Gpo141_00010695 [Globisporangium polare]
MGKKRGVAQKLAVADENNGSSGGSGVLLPGSTLEDYFHSKKLNDTGGLGQVSKHLLVGTPTNNAMAMEKEDVDGLKATPESSLRAAADKDAGDGDGLAESKDGAVEIDDEIKPGSKASDDNKVSEVDERHSNHDEYEDDYESDSPSPDRKVSVTSVAGMTLSDYLQAKETGGVADDEGATAKHAPPVKKHDVAAAPKPKAVVQPPVAKKAVPPALISGMSLDHYLGASSTNGDDDDGDDADSDVDSKSPTSKRKKSKTKVGAKSLLTISKQTTTTGAGVTQEEYATPFQKRLTKKLKAKTKQQSGAGGNGASISKSILLAEAPASSSSSFSGVSLQTKSIPLNGSMSSLKDTKDKKKPPQHQQHTHSQSSSQPPLPKLVASSSSAHSLLHSKEHQHDTDGNGSEDDERLPPLAHY